MLAVITARAPVVEHIAPAPAVTAARVSWVELFAPAPQRLQHMRLGGAQRTRSCSNCSTGVCGGVRHTSSCRDAEHSPWWSTSASFYGGSTCSIGGYFVLSPITAAPAPLMEHISRAPTVIASRAPVVEHVHQLLQVIAARAAVVEFTAASLPRSQHTHVRQRWSTSHHLLQGIAACAPEVEYIALSPAGDLITCTRGGVHRSSPCLDRSTCARGGVHRTSPAGVCSTCASGGVHRISPCLDRSTCASGGLHRTVSRR